MKKICIFFLITFSTIQLFAQGTFYVPSGTTIKPTGGVYLVFDDMNMVNNGTFQQSAGDGTIKFAGAGDESISGSGTTTIDSLELAKNSAANLNLQSNIDVVSLVNFNSGLLNFGNSIIDLGSTGRFKNESETSRAYSAGTGYVQSTEILNAPSAANTGNLGAIITSSANMGSTVVQRGFTSNGNIAGGKSILRYYVITPTNNTALNATYRFTYLDAELNGLAESSLNLWKSPDNSTWTDSGYTVRDTINNYVQKVGIDDFSVWTLAPPLLVLPITLSMFNAHETSGNIHLTWQVSAPSFAKTYQIERSSDGTDFTTLKEIPAASAVKYTFIDHQPVNGTNFYRLRVVDADGSIKYSSVLAINVNSRFSQAGFFPNPVVNNTVTLQLTNVLKGIYRLHVYNYAGQQVHSAIITHAGGSAAQTINLPKNLNAGVYKVRLQSHATVFYGSLLLK